MKNLIGIYEHFQHNGREVSRLLIEGLDTAERRDKFITAATRETSDALQAVRYDYSQTVHVYTSTTRKPFLEKYQL